MTTYIVTGSDTGIPRLPNDSVIAGLNKGDTFSTTLDGGVEAELIAAGLIAKSPLSSPVEMLSDGTLKAEDGRTFSGEIRGFRQRHRPQVPVRVRHARPAYGRDALHAHDRRHSA